MRSRGFTLIELLLVIAVIAILVGIIAGLVMNSRSRAQNARLQSDLKQLRVLSESYSNDQGSYAGWDLCVAGPGIDTCYEQALADSVQTLVNDIAIRQPNHNLTTTQSDDQFCMSLNLLTGSVACTDSSGEVKSDLPENSVCGEPPVCPAS